MQFRALDSLSTAITLALALSCLLALPGCSDPGKGATKAFDSGDYEKAMDIWMPLADKGDAAAQFGVAYLYEHGLGVPEDATEAVRWYRMAAEQGHASSQLNLGGLYQKGAGGLSSDLGRAADWYRMAAKQGNVKAQYQLGKMYYRGEGVPRNYELAFDWLQKAAEQKHVKAINHLGILYSRGLGVEQDTGRAFELVTQAAELGDPAAQLNLTTQYLRGKGTEQDFVEALKWHTIFKSHGIAGGGIPMDYVDNEMTPEQVVEAERRAAEWLEAHPAEPAD